jgi:hypothetical protein
MRLKKWSLVAVALLASASATLSYAAAENANRKPRPKRPSGAIGAGGAGTYARRSRPKTPTAAPTPQAPNGPANANATNANQTYIGGSTDGTGIRRKGPRKRRRP